MEAEWTGVAQTGGKPGDALQRPRRRGPERGGGVSCPAQPPPPQDSRPFPSAPAHRAPAPLQVAPSARVRARR